MAEDTNNSADFFDLLAAENEITDPFGNQEVFVKDASGEIKSLKADTAPVKVGVKEQSAQKPQASQKDTSGTPHDFSKQIQHIVQSSGVSVAEGQLRQRLDKAIEARLRRVRNARQTRDTLTGSPLNGDIGLSQVDADRVIAEIDRSSETFEEEHRSQHSSEPFADLQAEAARILSEEPAAHKQEPPELRFEKSVDKKPVEDKQTPALKISVPQSAAEKVAKAQEAPVSPSVKKPIRTKPAITPVRPAGPASSAPRTKRIEDVKFRPRLTGPIEELRTFSLQDFRRLSQDPAQAAQMILSKIDLLEEDSFTNKIAGIKAWKENEITQLYLSIGGESMEQKKPIDQVITERQEQNQPVLTQEEFDAVMDLNSRLRA